MMIFGIGIDVVEIERIGALLDRYEDRFAEKVFTKSERDYCWSQRDSRPHFAARFAAKEAVAKAFGTGVGKDLNWTDMEISRDDLGAPKLRLMGAGAAFAESRGIRQVMISLTHAKAYAAANAVALME
ncbi:MAG: holo-ACP synthase [Verrucomicrobiales bacterium]